MNFTTRIAAEQARPHIVPEAPPITVLGALTSLLQRKRLFALMVIIGVIPLVLFLGAMRPRYLSEATLELNFNREEVATARTVSRQMASMDPGALINGAAYRIASRANAIRVVRELGLAKASSDQGTPIFATIVGAIRRAFGLSGAAASPEEHLVDELLRNLKVSYKAHLYLIGVAYSARDPQTAARIANAFAIEYLRGERLKELSNQRGIAQSELLAVSEKLGALHPRRSQIESRIERIDSEIAGIANSPPEPNKFLLGGQYLTLAEPIRTPTSQKRLAIAAVGLSFVLALAALVAVLIDRLSAMATGGSWVRQLARLDKRK